MATTDSAHDLPIFADLAKGITLTVADQLWVADLTYIPIASGFAYVAIMHGHVCAAIELIGE